MQPPSRKPLLKRKTESTASVKQSAPSSKETREQQIQRAIETNNLYYALSQSPFVQDTLGWKKGFKSLSSSRAQGVYAPESDDIGVNPFSILEPDTASTTPLASRRTARGVVTHEMGHAKDYQARKKNQTAFPEYARVTRPVFQAPSKEGFDFSLKQSLPPVTVGDEVYDTQKGTVTSPASGGVRRLLGLLSPKIQQPLEERMRQKRTMTPSEKEAFANLDRYYALGGERTEGDGSKVLVTNPDEAFAQAYTNAIDFLSRTSTDTSKYRELLGRYEGNTPGAGAIVLDLLRTNPVYSKHPLKREIRG